MATPSDSSESLRGEEGTWNVARYIVTNPIRSGLTDDLDGYPFWGSLTHSREELLPGRLRGPYTARPPSDRRFEM